MPLDVLPDTVANGAALPMDVLPDEVAEMVHAFRHPVPVLMVPPRPNAVMDDEYLADNTLLTSIHGRIIKTISTENISNPHPSSGASENESNIK